MARGDGTGPTGMGPMTGRAAGYCAGYSAPGYMNSIPRRGLGLGLGRGSRVPFASFGGRPRFGGRYGRGLGRGVGFGRGRGRGRRF